MPTLQILQTQNGNNSYKVELLFKREGKLPVSTTVSYVNRVTLQDREDLRWYLEDYRAYPVDPMPSIANRIEKRVEEIGYQLFKGIFTDTKESSQIWALLKESLSDTRIEIVTDTQEGNTVLWELLRSPQLKTPLALCSKSFVRIISTNPSIELPPPDVTGPIRILLVISRPKQAQDIAFRSVTGSIIRSFGETDRFYLKVLRPPTFGALADHLQSAWANGTPYNIVHFDCHGVYEDLLAKTADTSPLRPRGYLIFEGGKTTERIQYVHGAKLGKLLYETGVSAAVLNACRSAHSGVQTQPIEGVDVILRVSQTFAFGSLGQEIVNAGVRAVVAMAYNTYVATAAHFVTNLYGSLALGSSLAESVNLGRRELFEQSSQSKSRMDQSLQDWIVPIIYESEPTVFFSKKNRGKKNFKIPNENDSIAQMESLEATLPSPPAAGFHGRDDILLSIDRAFDSESIVLLHGYEGSGKTSLAAEFARWYVLTNGIEPPVLYSSFQQVNSFSSLLAQIAGKFGNSLNQSTEEMQKGLIQIFERSPILWILDNIEQITGYPVGSGSQWSHDQQKQFLDFLHLVHSTNVKLLLTSHNDEIDWLADLPGRIPMSPMHSEEALRLITSLVKLQSEEISDIQIWIPIIDFAQGNPMLITVLVKQALRVGLETTNQVVDFLKEIRADIQNTIMVSSDESIRSVWASFDFGFRKAFNEQQQKVLSLLHFFHGVVNSDTFRLIGHQFALDESLLTKDIPKYSLKATHNLTAEQSKKLLDQAAEVGLLDRKSSNSFTIHPLSTLFLKQSFEHHYPPGAALEGESSDTALIATYAFVKLMENLGETWEAIYNFERGFYGVLMNERLNLLHAFQLAKSKEWWDEYFSLLRTLYVVYEANDDLGSFSYLLEEVVWIFIDPVSGNPYPHCNERVLAEIGLYSGRLAQVMHNWLQAEHLQQKVVEYWRQKYSSSVEKPKEKLSSEEFDSATILALTLRDLGHIQAEQDKSYCVYAYEESLEISKRIGSQIQEALTAYALATTYKSSLALYDLSQSEYWYKYCLGILPEKDYIMRGKCYIQLGSVARERLREQAQTLKKPKEEWLDYFETAREYGEKGIKVLPSSSIRDLAVAHGLLGSVYGITDQLTEARIHYNKSIKYSEAAGDFYLASQARHNFATDLCRAARFDDALFYAQSALTSYQRYGSVASGPITEINKLITLIKHWQKTS